MENPCTSCHVNEAAPLHLCPYAVTIREDDKQCTCCADCKQQCEVMMKEDLEDYNGDD